MKYKLVIFDWDGTLMNSVPRIVSSMQTAARLCGLVEPSDQAVRNIIGLSLTPALAILFPQQDLAVHQLVRQHYKTQYTELDPVPAPMFAGAVELLTDLHGAGYKLAVATGKGRGGMRRVMQMSQTEHLFHSARSADDAQSKPSPDMLHQILAELAIAPHEAIMIGDTEYDLLMAKAANIDRIGVSFGVHSPAQLQQYEPVAIVDSLAELRALLATHRTIDHGTFIEQST